MIKPLPPFPTESLRTLQRLADSARAERRAPRPTGSLPDPIILDVSSATRRPRWYVGRLLLTQDGVPVYRLHSEHSSIKSALEECTEGEYLIELEDE